VGAQYLEEFDQRHRRNRFAGFIAQKGSDAATKNRSRFFLILIQLSTDTTDKCRVNRTSIDFFVIGNGRSFKSFFDCTYCANIQQAAAPA